MARNRGIGRIKLLFALLMVAMVAFAGLFWLRTQAFADRPLVLDKAERVLMIERGDGFNAVLAKIRALGIDQGNDLEWKALAATLKVAQRLQVGDYAITSGMTPRILLLRAVGEAREPRRSTDDLSASGRAGPRRTITGTRRAASARDDPPSIPLPTGAWLLS